MNHPKQNSDVDWRVKWPDPEQLLGQTARAITSRLFFKITIVNANEETVQLTLQNVGDKHRKHTVSLDTLARNYNIVPADRL